MGLYLREVLSGHRGGGTSAFAALLGLAGIGQASAFRAMSVIVTRPLTGHSGFVGYILLRGLESPQFLKVMGIHVVATTLLAWRVSRGQANQPFCEICGGWTTPPKNAAVLPA